MRRPHLDAPVAQVLSSTSSFATILCPYCDGNHTHSADTRRHTTEWRAPGCGLVRTPAERLTGYKFNL